MDFPVEYLATFATIVDEGSFEAAARRLHITPSAVSLRVRAMETRVGLVLLQRGKPVTPTAAGATVLRLARQLDRLRADAVEELTAGDGAASIPLVVNADSLATWFLPALVRASRETGAYFEVLRADESESTELLRNGTAMAAVTAVREPVPGCTATPLGSVRYRALASPEFVARHFPDGVSAASLRAAPAVEFDRSDHLQDRFVRSITRVPLTPPRHFVPSSTEFATAVSWGLGWGMLPDAQSLGPRERGELVPLPAGRPIDLPLFWQRWNLESPALAALSSIVTEAAAAALLPTKK